MTWLADSKIIQICVQEPENIMLLDQKDFRPFGLLRGHTDWVFGIAWLDHRYVPSCEGMRYESCSCNAPVICFERSKRQAAVDSIGIDSWT